MGMGLGNGASEKSKAEETSSNGAGKRDLTPAGQNKGDGVYYIVSPEFTGGIGNREVWQ